MRRADWTEVCDLCGHREREIPAYSDDWRMDWWDGERLHCPKCENGNLIRTEEPWL